MRQHVQHVALASALSILLLAFPGCSPEEQSKGKMDGATGSGSMSGSMGTGKMQDGMKDKTDGMDKGPMSGKMETGKMQDGMKTKTD